MTDGANGTCAAATVGATVHALRFTFPSAGFGVTERTRYMCATPASGATWFKVRADGSGYQLVPSTLCSSSKAVAILDGFVHVPVMLPSGVHAAVKLVGAAGVE